MRILIISNLYPPYYLGGYEILCKQVVEGLKQLGHEIRVLTTTHGVENSAKADEKHIYRKLSLYCPFSIKAGLNRPARLISAIKNYKIAKHLAKKWRPDVAFVWSQLRLTTSAAKAVQELNIPTVFTFNDEHIAGFLPSKFNGTLKSFLASILDKTIFRLPTTSDLNLSNSTCISKLVKKKLLESGVPISSSKVIYQGIPVQNFPQTVFPGDEKCKNPVIIYAGQLHHYKGVHTLIEAANLLSESNKFETVTLKILGDGSADYKTHLQALAGGSATVQFMGRVDHTQMSQIYGTGNCFVFPSIWQEPFGLTHLEAMATGLPVISTADGGHGEFLLHNTNALVFEKENTNDLYEKLLNLLSNPALMKRLSKAGRETATVQFSLSRYVRDLEKLLSSVVQGGEP